MLINKKEIRSEIALLLNNQYRIDRSTYIEAAIVYGIYRAIGGEKTFVLPPYTADVVKQSYKVSKVKLRYKSVTNYNIVKVSQSLTNDTNINGQELVKKILQNNDYNRIYAEVLRIYIGYEFGEVSQNINMAIELFEHPWER